MDRVLVAVAALVVTTAAAAQEGAAAAPQVDLAALEGKVASLEEQYAETKTTVAALARFKWSGYVQGRYAWQEALNYNSTEGKAPDAKANPDRNGFFVRRGRLKLAYDATLAQFVVQLDVVPSGVSVKEAYGSLILAKLVPSLPGNLAVDAGLIGLPFGYDVGVRSSSDLDLLERYRGVGYFLKGEYDVGVALRGSQGPVNFKVGLFNGNGVDAGGGRDNDQLKDVIGRVGFDFGIVTGGVSGWYGKTVDYRVFPNKTYDRNRIGADLQVYLDLLPLGGTALKGEYIAGKTGIGSATDAGANLGVAGQAWQATLVQSLGEKVQLAGRYEQFTKNNNLATPASGSAVKRIDEVGVALHYYIGGNYKLSAAYYHPMDGKKVGNGGKPSGSVKDSDQFVVQAQARF